MGIDTTRQEKCAATLLTAITDYNELRQQYNDFINTGDTTNKEALLQFELRFNNLLGDLIPVSSRILGNSLMYNEKRASNHKSTLEVEIMRGGEKSQTKAKAYAAATQEHRDFLEEGIFWRESYNTIDGIINSIERYLTLITHYTKI